MKTTTPKTLFALFIICIMSSQSLSGASLDKFTIHWGSDNGTVGIAPKETRDMLAFGGPSSLCVAGNKLYILDSINCKVEVFSLKGKSLDSITLPGNQAAGNALEYSDIAVSPSGNIHVLESSKSQVLVVSHDGNIQTLNIPTKEMMKSFSTLSVKKDLISVFNSFKGSITQFTTSGKFVQTLKSSLFSDLIQDEHGIFYGASVKGGKRPDTKTITISKLSARAKKKALFSSYSGKMEINSYSLAGTDNKGNVYLTCSFGGADQTNIEAIFIFNENGAMTDKIKIPIITGKLTMTRSRTVSPDGVMVLAVPSKAGLKIITAKSRHY